MWQVVGHDRAVRLLQKSLDADRVSHAYLFSGPRHIGKSTLAVEFARAINCRQADRPCGQCRSCRKIGSSIHPDVQIVDLEEGSRNIGIDAIRGLQEGVALRPFEGLAKVYIIEEVERLSEPAANSLLKTLEEPPPSVVMVLTTLDATMLLPTLVSRCQQIALRPVPTATIEAALNRRHGIDPDRARLLAVLARGRVGLAMRMASEPSALDRRRQLIDRLTSIPEASRIARFEYAAELATLHGRDPDAVRAVLETWQSWWRDLLLSRLGMADMVVNVDLVDRILVEARRHSVETLGRMVAAVQETRSLLAQNVNARLALEVLMLSAPRAPDPR